MPKYARHLMKVCMYVYVLLLWGICTLTILKAITRGSDKYCLRTSMSKKEMYS